MTIIADIEGSGGGPTGTIVSEVIFGGPLNNLKEAQTFQVIEGTWDVTSVSLMLDRNFTAAGSAETGNLTLYIKEDSPSGAVLGTSAVERTDISLTPDWKSFSFSGVALSSGNVYCLVLECPYGFDDKPTGVGGQGDDLILWFIDPGAGPYAQGERHYYNDENGWIESSTQDNRAVVHGDSAAPSKPITPSPADVGTGVTLDQATLGWVDGGDADTYDVYFGPSGSMELQSEGQAGLSWNIDSLPLLYNTAYQWRIDAVNAYGTTTGDTWTFTALVFAPPAATVAGSATPNMMQVIKRLVAAAANTFWYEDV